MKKVYTIVTYLLMLPASFLAILCFFLLIISLMSFDVLGFLYLFIFGCVVIYTFCVNVFNQKIIVQEKTAKAKLKDWIMVNAFVTGVFAFMNISNLVSFLLKPATSKQNIEELLKNQQGMFGAQPLPISTLAKMYHFVSLCVGIYGIVLVLHIFYTVFLMKNNKEKFV